METDKPYTILSPTKITLSPLAREMCKLHGMTEEQMAKHLLSQEKLRQAGQTRQEGQS
jgi:hypothetical protein